MAEAKLELSSISIIICAYFIFRIVDYLLAWFGVTRLHANTNSILLPLPKFGQFEATVLLLKEHSLRILYMYMYCVMLRPEKKYNLPPLRATYGG
jgi:hypothetical protein